MILEEVDVVSGEVVSPPPQPDVWGKYFSYLMLGETFGETLFGESDRTWNERTV